MYADRVRSAAVIDAVLISVGTASACSDAPTEGWKQLEGADSALIQTFTYADGQDSAKGAWIIVGQTQPATTVAVAIAGTGADTDLISHVKDSLVYEHSEERVDQDGKPLGDDAS